MIKATGLRIGNWVNALHNEFMPVQVTWNSLGLDDVPFDPIPLTIEVLEQSGFKYDSRLECWDLEIGRVIFRFRKQDDDLTLIYQPDIAMYWIAFPNTCEAEENLHSLQNLIFSLTGVELEVRIPEVA